MLKITLLMVMLFILTTCAAPGDLRNHQADIDQMTDKPAELVAGCIGDKLEYLSSQTTLSTRPTSNGYSISAIQNGGFTTDTIVLVDINKLDSKTHVQLFIHDLAWGNERIISAVRGCI